MRNLIAKAIDVVLSKPRGDIYKEMRLTPEGAEARRSASPGPIEELFFANQGRLVHKWIHYLPVYDRVLAPYHQKPITMLEIGVSKGGSLELWRKFFGPDATIYGIDIDPACAKRVDPPNQVRIGSQGDPAFLRKVLAETGPPDIILDDGSHISSHQRISFEVLFPALKPGGLYMIEDLHTAYWPRWEGGYRRAGTGIELVKALIDDMHGWHHGRGARFAGREWVQSVEIHDSIAVITKGAPLPAPGHFSTGHTPE
ncbi:MAG: class I SAM-dependent methyltransferase [Phenylobacterium sp.]|uniref:class I SAM-dependent methyltransferase n=1 Tax=Phenylobacterium sp. TaxID=1871053 RepID=UPI0025F622C6|nr:class I SAM-dependent methyltransferase [Phenylobacterium sp.]MBI1197556.1 class I SAM-dependent methyltransferase [Phenylobacterium sp.]